MSENLSNPFPTRVHYGQCQVLVSAGMDNAEWVDCSDEDRDLLRFAMKLCKNAVSAKAPTQALINQLKKTAEVLAKYDFSEGARLCRGEADIVRKRLRENENN